MFKISCSKRDKEHKPIIKKNDGRRLFKILIEFKALTKNINEIINLNIEMTTREKQIW